MKYLETTALEVSGESLLAPASKAGWGRMKEVKIMPGYSNDPSGMPYAPYRELSGNL